MTAKKVEPLLIPAAKRSLFYILEGEQAKPVPMMVHMDWMIAHPDRHVALDNINGLQLSTVFLGIDHGYSVAGPPILFETMLFGKKGEPLEVQRYATWAEAQAGHAALLKAVKKQSATHAKRK